MGTGQLLLDSHLLSLVHEPLVLHLKFIHSFIHVFISRYPFTGATEGCEDSHNIIHNISVELQMSYVIVICNLHNKLSISHAIELLQYGIYLIP